MTSQQPVTQADLVPGFKHIVIAEGYLGGRPAVLGRRISVDQILHWLGEGMSAEDIETLYELDRSVILEALHFAAVQIEKLHVAS